MRVGPSGESPAIVDPVVRPGSQQRRVDLPGPIEIHDDQVGIHSDPQVTFAIGTSDDLGRSLRDQAGDLLQRGPSPVVPLGEQDGEHRRQPGEPGGGSPDRALFVLELMQEHGLTIEDIERITVHLPEIYLRPHQYVAAPRTYLEGSCSIQRRTALGILGAVPGHEWFTEERFADPVARDMASRIEIVEDPEGSEVFAARRFYEVPNTVELHAGGRTYTKSALMSNILGSPGYPMPTEMIEDKFHRLTDPAIGHGRAELLLEALNKLTSITDANELAELF